MKFPSLGLWDIVFIRFSGHCLLSHSHLTFWLSVCPLRWYTHHLIGSNVYEDIVLTWFFGGHCLLWPKSNQHIHKCKYICDQNWVKLSSLVWDIVIRLPWSWHLTFWPNQYVPDPGAVTFKRLNVNATAGNDLWLQKWISTSTNQSICDQNWAKFPSLVFVWCSQGFPVIAYCDLDIWPFDQISMSKAKIHT